MIKFIKTLIGLYRFKKEMINHIMHSPYKDTLYQSNWIIKNHEAIMDILPDSWTHVDNIDFVMFGLKLKLLNVPWKNRNDLLDILSYFEMIGVLNRKNGYHIIRNTDNSFGNALRSLSK